MTPRKGLPEVWTTGAAKYLVGDNPCLLRVWLPAWFRLDRIAGDESALTRWKVRHTEQLQATVAKYQADGWRCSVEKYFRMTGQTAILTGKVDLLVQKLDCRPKIIDCKGGEPQNSDVAQVQTYQIALPLSWSAPAMQLDGEVVYASHSVKVTPAEALELKPKLFGLLKRIGQNERPVASPSESACRWCPVPKSECPDRIDVTEAPVGVLTTEW